MEQKPSRSWAEALTIKEEKPEDVLSWVQLTRVFPWRKQEGSAMPSAAGKSPYRINLRELTLACGVILDLDKRGFGRVGGREALLERVWWKIGWMGEKRKLLVYGDKDLWRVKWVSDEKINFGATAHVWALSANLLNCRFILLNCSTGPSAPTWIDTDCAGSETVQGREVVPLSGLLVSAVSPGSLLNERSLRDPSDTLAYLLSAGLVLPSCVRCRGPGTTAEHAGKGWLQLWPLPAGWPPSGLLWYSSF